MPQDSKGSKEGHIMMKVHGHHLPAFMYPRDSGDRDGAQHGWCTVRKEKEKCPRHFWKFFTKAILPFVRKRKLDI